MIDEDFIISKKDWIEFFGDRDIITKEEYSVFCEFKNNKKIS